MISSRPDIFKALKVTLLLGSSFLSYAPQCLAQAPMAACTHFVGGRWFDGMQFREDDFYAENGVLTHHPASTQNLVTVELHGGFIVPPYGDAHEHNFDSVAAAPGVTAKYLHDGIFYAQGMTDVTSGARQVIAAGLVNTTSTIDVTYAHGCLTALQGHPKEIYESVAHGFYYPSTPEQRAEVISSHSVAGDAYWEIDTAADLDRNWPAILAAKPDLIKIILSDSDRYTADSHVHPELGKGLDPSLVPLITARAHRAGLKVAAHIDTAADFHVALVGGVDEMGHLPGYGIREGDPIARYRISDADIALAAKRHVKVQPTAGVDVSDQTPAEDIKRRQASQLDNLARLKSAGVPILVGSDHYGEDSLHEAEYLQSLGLWTNLEMLTMWSVTTPQDIFPGRKIGQLKEGYEASFLVLSANPVDNWQAVHDIVGRWKRGHCLDSRDSIAGVAATKPLPAPARPTQTQELQPTGTVRADPAAQALLKAVEVAVSNVRTLTADVEQIDQSGKSVEATMRLMRPNFASIVYRDREKSAAPAYVLSDGKTVFRYPDATKNEYLRDPAESTGNGIVDWLGGVPIQAFFGLRNALKSGGIDDAKLTRDGLRVWEGERYQVLRHDFEEEGKRYTSWIYVGSDNLIHRQVGTFYIPGPKGKPRTFEVALRRIKVNTPMKADEFAYAPPADAKQLIPRIPLANGTAAPDFQVESQRGAALRLSDFRGKVVVLDFWATWCVPCLRGFGETNAVAAKFKDKDVVVLAVNVWDNASNFQAWMAAQKNYDSLVFALDPAAQGRDVASLVYHVSAIPTQFVIDKNGRVAASIVGYAGPSTQLDSAVETAVALPPR